MNNRINRLFGKFKRNGEQYGTVFFLLGLYLLGALIILNIADAIINYIWNSNIISSNTNSFLVSLALALLSLALGSIAIGMAAKSDKVYTEVLERMDGNLKKLPYVLADKVTPPTQQLVLLDETKAYNKEAAQKRLDDDTKQVGYVRGELYEVERGKWAIHWGGKHPL
jgi:glucan phosphoethanolaminetransferase (alkaline phosphatase superfamily)